MSTMASTPGNAKQGPETTYKWLRLEDDDIRILTLLPGQFDDEIRIQISHIHFLQAVNESGPRLSLKELRKTLPSGWTVHEAYDGRYLFVKRSSEAALHFELDSWTHPNPELDRSLYDPLSYDPPSPLNDSFEALSYAWGSSEDPVLIKVKGRTSIGTISVGRNLESALRHLRSEDKPRKLWIDAICINQSDNDEKSVQVRRMGRIYESAYRVVAWLGPEKDDSGVAMSTLGQVGSFIVITSDHYILSSPDIGSEDLGQHDKDLAFEVEVRDALCALLAREWFTRRWVVQEITLARRTAVLQCGQHTIPWSTFRQASHCLYLNFALAPTLRRAVIRLFPFNSPPGMTSLMELVGGFCDFECSDPLDTVYALLGIMPPTLAARLQVDYSISTLDLFRSMFLAHVDVVQRWELFGSPVAVRGCGGPSWVPDLSTDTWTGGLTAWFGQYCSGSSRIHITYSRPDVIQVTGLKCASVTTATFAIYGSEHEQHRLVRSCVPPDMDKAIYVAGEDFSDVFARTLLSNHVQDRWPDSAYPSLKDWKGSLLSGLANTSSTEVSFDPFDDSTYVGSLARRASAGRSLLTTAEGYIGLRPPGTEPGDIICVVLGCDTPVVLRRLPRYGYKLVGHAFVHGLHDSIPLLGPLPRSWRMEIIGYPGSLNTLWNRFVNDDTGEVTREDPRLEPHPDWERVDPDEIGRELTGDDPQDWDFFRNKNTREVINHDPRLLPEVLKARGVPLKQFALL